jgi:hypothetical protein
LWYFLSALCAFVVKKIGGKMNPFIQALARQLATQINDKINVPFLNEAQEQMFFELVVTKVFELVLGHWLSLLEPGKEKESP